MTGPRAGFVDTNVLLHLFSTDDREADRASSLLEEEPVISVQVQSDTAVARRWRVDRRRIDDSVAIVLGPCRVEALSFETCRDARRLAARYGRPWYDAMIVASALGVGCIRLYSKDFQQDQVFDRKLELFDPFR